MTELINLVDEIRSCQICKDLPLGPRPVLQVGSSAQILVVGQAPGTAVHNSGVPFDDPSGDRLRKWLGVDHATFYDPEQVALVPMGFCYPGRGSGGDLPPRKECAPAWRDQVLGHLTNIELTVMIGRYAIDWHLQPAKSNTLTDIVREWQQHLPSVMPLPHPSPRNTMWLRRNPWVDAEMIPALQQRVREILG